MTWGFKGLFKRALEFPAAFGARVAPLGRMRIRYNEQADQGEISTNGAAYQPFALGAGVRAYGSLYIAVAGATQALTTAAYDLVTLWGVVGVSSHVTGALAPSYSLTPSTDGDYMVEVNMTLVGDVGLGYDLAVFVNGIVTHLGCSSGNSEGTAARVISCADILALNAGDVVDVRMKSVGGNGNVALGRSQFTLVKES